MSVSDNDGLYSNLEAVGWTLEGLAVDRKKTERVPDPSQDARTRARANAERWAKHVGVPFIDAAILAKFREEAEMRTLYTFDVRDPEEYAAEHPVGFISAPGGQLVQAIDEWVGVRGARIVLYDNDGVRARMTASWLIQMGWDVFVLGEGAELPLESSFSRPTAPTINLPTHSAITVTNLQDMKDVSIVDLARSPIYKQGHIPGAYFASGPELSRDLSAVPGSGLIVLTSPTGSVAAANVTDAQESTSRSVQYLSGGTDAWVQAGGALDVKCNWLSEPIDVYKRPYEGTDNARANMQSYIDWELQLVAQLANDGVSGFHVARAAP
jgi:rhodanese-related sulfurtransferase